MPDYLFVCGTLMTFFDNPAARFLREHGRLLGEASIAGRLYDLGSYPGLVCGALQGEGRVRGELFELPDPEFILPVLDEYEGIDPDRPEAGEYRRDKREAFAGGRSLPCWVYVYTRDTEGFPEIEGGDYQAYLRKFPKPS